MRGSVWSLALLAVLGAAPALAQPSGQDDGPPGTAPVFVVPRLTGPVTLDGHVDEAAWDAVAPLPLVKHWPESEHGAAPSEPTEIRVAHDDDHVYVSCRCYAPPEAVFASSFKRDLWTRSTDYLALTLDTYGDRENGVVFEVSPTGSRTDAAISKDANVAPSTSWNTFWDAETQVTDEGWFAEMRIPFSSLRYRGVGGRVEMGMTAMRLLGLKNELNIYPATPPEWGFWSFLKPSQFQRVAFEGVRPSRRPVYVTPYALGGLGQTFDLNADGAAYIRTDDAVTELGGDLKMGLTDDLTLDLTLNTDFAQVEADDPQVNLTRFSLFFPEKRQFFLERADLFDVGLDGSNQLFYSRRIGLNGGQAVRLLGGGRVVGGVGPWAVGALSLQTGRLRTGFEETLPSENFSVVRLRRPVFNANSTAGGMVTSRVGEDGTYNVAVGLDGDVRLFGQTFLALNGVQTFDDAVDGSGLDATRLRATMERRVYVGTSYELTAVRAGPAYRPDLGFERRDDYTALGGEVGRGWSGSPDARLSRHRARLDVRSFFRNADVTAESAEATLAWYGILTTGQSFDVSATTSYEDLREGFSLTDEVDVAPGSYTFSSASVSTALAPDALAGDLYVGGGPFYDGWRVTAGVAPQWLVSKHLEVSGGYEVNRIAFPDRDQAFTAHVGRVRVLAALNTKLSAAAFLQVNSTASAGLANVRIRYNPREGTDVYLVWNEGFHTERLRTGPARPFTSGRAFLAKYTYTFSL